MQFLVPLVWWVLIARVVHAESLPGDRQFWLSRPYRWTSRLSAKLLFMVTFINVPLLVADTLIVRAHGQPGDRVSRLALAATVGYCRFIVPVFVLAALTSSTTKLLITMVLLAVTVLGAYIVAPQIGGEVAWIALNWVRSQYTLIVVVIASAFILALLYARRRIAFARALAGLAGALAVFGNLLFPWTSAWAIQSHMPSSHPDLSSVRVNFDEARNWVGICSASKTPDQRNYFVLCSTAFRRQSGLVSVLFVGSGRDRVQEATAATLRNVSYSPLPAELSIDPVTQYFTFSTLREPPSAVVVERIEPVAHIGREFEFTLPRLGDFEVQMSPLPR